MFISDREENFFLKIVKKLKALSRDHTFDYHGMCPDGCVCLFWILSAVGDSGGRAICYITAN